VLGVDTGCSNLLLLHNAGAETYCTAYRTTRRQTEVQRHRINTAVPLAFFL